VELPFRTFFRSPKIDVYEPSSHLEWHNVANKASLEPKKLIKYYELKLFFSLVIIESLCVVGGFWTLFYFVSFGSGAGASSDKAMLTENVTFVILFFITITFGNF
jgi:hypothetical protein